MPVIKSIHHSGSIFDDGDDRMVMKILANLIWLLPLCLNALNEELLKSSLGESVKDGLEFMNIFT